MNPNYNITIYDALRDGTARFILGTKGNKTLIAIGLNPSHANRIKSDFTVTKVMGFKDSAAQKFDSFIMLNLYPQRATDPADVHKVVDEKLYQENLKTILETLKSTKNASVLAAWGETVLEKEFFIRCLADIYEFGKNIEIEWLQIGKELTQKKHPRHPSRAAYVLGLHSFDFNDYFQNVVQKIKK